VFDGERWFADVPDIQRAYSWLSGQLFRLLFPITPLRRLDRDLHYHFPA
jgi:hypothetical protein